MKYWETNYELTPKAQHASDPTLAAKTSDGETTLATAYLKTEEDKCYSQKVTESICVQLLDPTRAQQTDLTLTSSEERYLFPPAVTATPNGFVALWTEGVGDDWRLQGYSVSAEKQTQHLFAFKENDIRYHRPTCDCADDGTLWVAYEKHSGRDVEIMLVALNAAGDVQTEQKISDEGNAYDPVVFVATDGTVYCAWTAFRDGSYRIAFCEFATNEPNTTYITPADHHCYYPGLTTDPSGRPCLTWVSFDGPECVTNTSLRSAFVQHDLRKHVQNFWIKERRMHVALRDEGVWKKLDADQDEQGDGDITMMRRGYWPKPLFLGDGTPIVFCRMPVEKEDSSWKFSTRAVVWQGNTWETLEAFSDEKTGGENHPPAIAGSDQSIWCISNTDNRSCTTNFDYLPGYSTLLFNGVTFTEARRPELPLSALSLTEEGSDSAPQRPPSPAFEKHTINADNYELIFGQSHRHTELSVCAREINAPHDFHYRHAIDLQTEGWGACADHGMHMDPHDWRLTNKMAAFYNRPGAFAAFPAQEWTSSNMRLVWSIHGHINLYHLDENQPFYNSNSPKERTPWQVWEYLDPAVSFTIPHHTHSGSHPYDWDAYDADLLPVCELFQDLRGSSEYPNCPATTDLDHVDDPQLYTWHALERGYRFGFIGGGDHCGVALAGVFVRECSRQGVHEALQARRCFATTGCHACVKFWVDDGFMGEEIEKDSSSPCRIEASVSGESAVQNIVLVKDAEEIYATETDTLAHEDTGPRRDVSWYYIRAEFTNGELAWSSPVWVNAG